MVQRRQINGGGGAVPRYHFNSQLVEDLTEFSQWQYDCLDYDPFHPMLVHLGKGLPREDALWLSTLYMAFYNIGSAWVAFKSTDRLKPLPEWVTKLPVGVQRRNLRGGRIVDHLESFTKLSKSYGSIYKYLTEGMGDDPSTDWLVLKENVQKSWGNGRWSVYTTSELYQKVNKLPALPSEIGNDGSSGPRAGLSRIYGVDLPRAKESLPILDGLADRLFQHLKPQLKTRIFYLPKGHYDHGMLESQLCDFNSMCKGRYYIGRDIDRDQERIRSAEKALTAMGQRMSLGEVWAAREAVFDKRYLGEFSGWRGRTEEAKTHYVRTGRIADHMQIREELRAGRFFL